MGVRGGLGCIGLVFTFEVSYHKTEKKNPQITVRQGQTPRVTETKRNIQRKAMFIRIQLSLKYQGDGLLRHFTDHLPRWAFCFATLRFEPRILYFNVIRTSR